MTEKFKNEIYNGYTISMEYKPKLGGFRAILFSFWKDDKKIYYCAQKLVQSGNRNAPYEIVVEQLKYDGLREVKKIIDSGKYQENINCDFNFSDLKRLNGEFFLKL